jgi:hypothetical protein
MLVAGLAYRQRVRVTQVVGRSAVTVSHVLPRVYRGSVVPIDQQRTILEVDVLASAPEAR